MVTVLAVIIHLHFFDHFMLHFYVLKTWTKCDDTKIAKVLVKLYNFRLNVLQTYSGEWVKVWVFTLMLFSLESHN